MLSKDVRPLPPNGESLAGESSDQKENYSLLVSNADGYLCHLQATCHFPVTPATVYAIFINTGETALHAAEHTLALLHANTCLDYLQTTQVCSET